MKRTAPQEDVKPEIDIHAINTMLRNSFSAIKVDMIRLKDAQEDQLKDVGSIKKDIKDIKHGSAAKDDIKRLKESIASLEAKQKVMTSKLNEMEVYSQDIVKAVNTRLKDLKKEFDRILKIKEDLQFKLKTFDRLEEDFRELRKQVVKKDQLEKVLDQVNEQFDKLEEKQVSKADLAKLDKRVEKLEKKKSK